MMNAAEDACKLLEQDPGNCDFEPYSMIQVTWYKASLYGIFESGIQVHFYIFNKHLNISLLTFCKHIILYRVGPTDSQQTKGFFIYMV